jgi:hypothetical protein
LCNSRYTILTKELILADINEVWRKEKFSASLEQIFNLTRKTTNPEKVQVDLPARVRSVSLAGEQTVIYKEIEGFRF